MTNPTPHGQVPEAPYLQLAYLLASGQHLVSAERKEAAAAIRDLHAENEALRTAHVQNPAAIEQVAGDVSKNGVELNMSTQQPVAQQGAADGFFLLLPQRPKPEAPAGTAGLDWDAYSGAQMLAFGRDCSDAAIAAPAASPTPPAEQQATKETSGGFHVWRDIYTAPKDGSRFVATGHNYGLYSEGRHICVAQWFRGCWMETSDWNEASELQHLTHWLPLPSPPDDVAAPAEQQAAPKAAPGEQDDHQILAITTAYEQGVGKGHQAYNSGKEIANPYSPAYRCDLAWQYGYKEGKEQAQREANAAPQPAPAPLSESIDQVERALAIIGVVGAIDGHDVVRRESVLEIARRAALAAQGGK